MGYIWKPHCHYLSLMYTMHLLYHYCCLYTLSAELAAKGALRTVCPLHAKAFPELFTTLGMITGRLPASKPPLPQTHEQEGP